MKNSNLLSTTESRNCSKNVLQNENVSIFQSSEFGSVRTIQLNDKVLFCGKDVAVALGYKNESKALNDHCKSDEVTNRYPIIDSLGRTQKARFITESDVYRLIAHSKLESAQKFESWVFEEVLPSIRKTGGYFSTPRTFAEALRLAADQQEQIEAQQKQLQEQKPKVEVYDDLVSRDYARNFRDSASHLGLKQNEFMEILKSKYIYRKENGEYRAYSEYSEYFILRPFKVGEKEKEQLMVSIKGLEYFMNRFGKKIGIEEK